jgi:hypothetical protein
VLQPSPDPARHRSGCCEVPSRRASDQPWQGAPLRGETDDLQPFLDALADHVVLTIVVEELRGSQAVIDYFVNAGETMEFRPFERPLEYFGAGDRVVVVGDETFTVKQAGATYRADCVWLDDLHDRQITRLLAIQTSRASRTGPGHRLEGAVRGERADQLRVGLSARRRQRAHEHSASHGRVEQPARRVVRTPAAPPADFRAIRQDGARCPPPRTWCGRRFAPRSEASTGAPAWRAHWPRSGRSPSLAVDERGRAHGRNRRTEHRSVRAPRRSEGAAVVGLACRARRSGRGRGRRCREQGRRAPGPPLPRLGRGLGVLPGGRTERRDSGVRELRGLRDPRGPPNHRAARRAAGSRSVRFPAWR